MCLDFPQFDADRDEDEVFYDISMAVDSKLFPNKEAAAGKSPCPFGQQYGLITCQVSGALYNVGAQQSAASF